MSIKQLSSQPHPAKKPGAAGNYFNEHGADVPLKKCLAKPQLQTSKQS